MANPIWFVKAEGTRLGQEYSMWIIFDNNSVLDLNTSKYYSQTDACWGCVDSKNTNKNDFQGDVGFMQKSTFDAKYAKILPKSGAIIVFSLAGAGVKSALSVYEASTILKI